ncbi:YbjQ family protein [Rhizobium oryziradicis]|jgi:uncharacterized protein YbjQ (UPF0145 family)|uniref:YbjQ family protein n=1 Tax=Rhizobium oryziradicis TaxID=1867956 RepID=UPI0009F9043F|nr:YbjQ family protein [Rhizobium oryziradicis]
MPICKNCGTSYYLGSPDGFCGECEDTMKAAQKKTHVETIILTTSIDIPNRKIDRVVSIVANEVAIGLNIFKDIANNWRGFIGGRSSTSEKALKEARNACLEGLKHEAAEAGANAVIAVNVNYSQISTTGSGDILFIAATGTAVVLQEQ